MSTQTVRDVLDHALDAYAGLGELGEGIEDEWSYVTDLTETWRSRLEDVATIRGQDEVSDDIGAAIDRAADEIGSITDPHRAIDWLSTFPQVVLLAIGERP